MNRVWLWMLPFLFLPSFGAGITTGFGVLELIDLLLIPFLPALLLSPRIQGATLRGEIKWLGSFFVLWAFATVLRVYVGYDYEKPLSVFLFSALKVGKFLLYSFVGLAISHRLTSDEIRRKFHFSIVGVGAMMGIALSLISLFPLLSRAGEHSTYRTNAISTGLSIVFVYILTLYMRSYGSPLWRKWALAGLAFMLIGSSFSAGRGGWLAALVGLLYTLAHVQIRMRSALIGMTLVAGVLMLYGLNESFRIDVDRTLFPNQDYLKLYHFGVGGVDDGGRLVTWMHEFPKISQNPIFGTGFHHRGILSGLWETGSHNFWLQMFLETGLIGGLLMLFLFFKMWKHAQIYSEEDPNVSIALRAALITAFIGGLSGEYFYGSYGLLSFLLVYAVVGSKLRSSPSAH